MATCDINTLLESGKCFACLTPGQLDIIELQLLCDILAAGGGGGGGGSQTPWLQNIDGGGFNLSNLGLINGVKVYRALLTQSGTDAPVATVLENSLGGTVVWTRDDLGLYTGTLVGAFTANKTWCLMKGALNTEPNFGKIEHGTSDTVTITTMDNGGGGVDSAMTATPVEILVYP